MALTLKLFDTRAKQQRAMEILQFKLDVLWSILDAMWMAYVEHKPPYFSCEPVPQDP
jgi:pyrroloquinoline-quinone synthase